VRKQSGKTEPLALVAFERRGYGGHGRLVVAARKLEHGQRDCFVGQKASQPGQFFIGRVNVGDKLGNGKRRDISFRQPCFKRSMRCDRDCVCDNSRVVYAGCRRRGAAVLVVPHCRPFLFGSFGCCRFFLSFRHEEKRATQVAGGTRPAQAVRASNAKGRSLKRRFACKTNDRRTERKIDEISDHQRSGCQRYDSV
jgi:hypothetical protein